MSWQWALTKQQLDQKAEVNQETDSIDLPNKMLEVAALT